MLIAALALAAAVAGLTGTWSPCGFSMIETIGAPRRSVLPSCAAFALGAALGGAVTFGAVALAGVAVHGSGRRSALVAAGIALIVAVAELCGAPIRPQIRRQVPERWRRILPLPLAALLYGVLLGLAFTTFVLTFAVWALAAVIFTLGRPEMGVVVGLAFGIGRAVPIVSIAPLLERPVGVRLLALIGERPAILRAVRVADGAALLVAACTIVVSQASAATTLGAGFDPSAAGGIVVWTTTTGGVELREGESGTASVPPHAVLGGSLIAWRDGDAVHVANAADLTPVVDVTVPGVDALAVSDAWLVTRAASPAGDTLSAFSLPTPGQPRVVASARRPTAFGRPTLDGDTLVYHVAGPRDSRIVERNLATSDRRVLRHSTASLLLNPALLDGELLYVRQTDLAQLLELGPAATRGYDRVVYRIGAPAVHDSGHEHGYSHKTRTPHPKTASSTLWTTALSATHAYVTLLPRQRAVPARIVSIAR
jgi:hypothetical protein